MSSLNISVLSEAKGVKMIRVEDLTDIHEGDKLLLLRGNEIIEVIVKAIRRNYEPLTTHGFDVVDYTGE